MGQKTNASIFRLGLKNSEWKYKYIEKNSEESSIFLYKTIEIQKYIDNIFKFYNLLVHSCKIEYTQTTVNILIYFYESNLRKNESNKSNKKITSFIVTNFLIICLNLYLKKNKLINIKTQNLNKKFEDNSKNHVTEYKKALKLCRRFLRTSVQKDFIKIIFISISTQNSAKLLANAISMYISNNKKKHNFLLFFLKKIITCTINLDSSITKGIKITITGRFNGVPRAKKKILQIGAISLQSFKSSVSYYNSVAYTPNGSFGVKVWICEK